MWANARRAPEPIRRCGRGSSARDKGVDCLITGTHLFVIFCHDGPPQQP
eukprot:COSAG01_NODE_14526_length_1442_cov_25.885331_2_plen_48_part_01